MEKLKLILILTTVLIAGCMDIPFIKNISQYFRSDQANSGNFYKTNIDIKSLRIPQKGEKASIYDRTSGQEIEVTFGEVYTAASGKFCTLFSYNTENNERISRGLTCMEREGDWYNIPLILLNNK